MSRTDQWHVSLGVDGVDVGTFDVKTGGDQDTTELTYMPGAMGPQISLGGMVTVAAVVLNRIYKLEDQARVHWLLGRVGKGKCVVRQQPLDVNGHAYQKGYTIHGTLKRVKLPDVDSNATNAAILEVEVTPAGVIV